MAMPVALGHSTYPDIQISDRNGVLAGRNRYSDAHAIVVHITLPTRIGCLRIAAA